MYPTIIEKIYTGLSEKRWWRSPPFGIISTTSFIWQMCFKNCSGNNSCNQTEWTLTGSSKTTPKTLRILGCLNCPMMATSCKNLTLISSSAASLIDFTATSTVFFVSRRTPWSLLDVHNPRCTVPNSPVPKQSWRLDYMQVGCVTQQ